MPADRHLLLLSYFWPPFGGAGVQRALKLAQAAPSFGWRCSVVAGKPRESDAQDPSMLTDEVAKIRVARVDHGRIGGRLWRLRSWTPPDPYRLWHKPALQAARQLCKEDRPDAILSTSMPYTAHLVAVDLKGALEAEAGGRGIPWLADLRDPWTDNRFHAYYQGDGLRSRFRRWADRRLELRTYNEAALVSVTSAGLQRLLIDRWGLSEARVILARNGYDEADFSGILPLPGQTTTQAAPPGDRPMKVLFAGSMYAGYDIEAFFAAWQRLLERRPDLRMELVAHTQSASILKRLCTDYPDAGKRTTTGPRVSHQEVIKLYGEADLLVLATLDDLSIPGKLFEYIRTSTPVLAFAAAGAESWALLEQTGAGEALCDPDAGAVAQLERKVAYRRIFAALDAQLDVPPDAQLDASARS